MPINEKMVAWDSPKIDPRMVGWDDSRQEGSTIQDIASGLLRGAGSIGATVLAPADMVNSALDGKGFFNLDKNRERRHAMDMAFSGMGADTGSTAYQLSKIGSEIMGTAGAGGGAANLLSKAPQLATKVPGLVDAIRTGGMVSGGAGMPTRIAGGAISGGAMAGLADPTEAGTGAAIGGALPPVVKLAGKAGGMASGLVKKAIGAATGVGDEAVNMALQAGRNKSSAFVENMRGEVPLTNVLDDAKAALGTMRADRAAEYRANMSGIRNDKTVLGFSGIDQSIADAAKRVGFKGQTVDARAASALDDVAKTVDEWKSLNPAEYHTPEGLDALKQKIGAIMESIPYEQRNARAVVGGVYNEVKSQISSQAPEYAKTMKAYSEASELITEIEKSLSLGQSKSADTAMRKLQSLMRNNVNTNYGNRLDLAKSLESKGGTELLTAISGQSMNSWLPRGLARLGPAGAGLASMSNPAAIAAVPFTSPRLMGEALYGLGRAQGATSRKLNALLGHPSIGGGMPSLAESMAVNPLFRAGLLEAAP